jgi:hypothetical protein
MWRVNRDRKGLYRIWKPLQLLESRITLPFGMFMVFLAQFFLSTARLMRIGIMCYPAYDASGVRRTHSATFGAVVPLELVPQIQTGG